MRYSRCELSIVVSGEPVMVALRIPSVSIPVVSAPPWSVPARASAGTLVKLNVIVSGPLSTKKKVISSTAAPPGRSRVWPNAGVPAVTVRPPRTYANCVSELNLEK